jgi:hypothetical protein
MATKWNYRNIFFNLLVKIHKAYSKDILHKALSGDLYHDPSNYRSGVKIGPGLGSLIFTMYI